MRLSVAQNRHADGGADLRLGDPLLEILGIDDRVAVKGKDDIASQYASLVCGRPRHGRCDKGSLGVAESELSGQAVIERAHHHAEPRMDDPPPLDDVLVNATGHVRGDGEADPFGAAAAADDEVVDPDHPPVDIDKRASGVARIDRGAGLEELVGLLAGRAPPFGADDSLRHGLLKAEGVADGEDHLADPYVLRVAEGDRGQSLGIDLEHGNVGALVCSGKARREGTSVVELDGDLGGAGDHVPVGDDVTLGTDDHSRAHLVVLGNAAAPESEELPYQRLAVRKRCCRDADDRGNDMVDKLRELPVHGLERATRAKGGAFLGKALCR